MNLINICERHIRAKDSGLLSIKIEGNDHLFKVYFEKGEIVSISLGGCKNEECLKKLSTFIPVDYSFIKGVRAPTMAVPPLTEQIMELFGRVITGPKTLSPGRNDYVKAEVLAAVEEEFIGMIGPIGKMIIDNIFSEISYRRGSPMPSEDYFYFLESLKKELNAQQQVLFSAKYGKG